MPEETAASAGNHPHHPQTVQLAVRLSDTLVSNRALTSFSSFTRHHAVAASLGARLTSASERTTVLAPLNSAIDALLPRKPWEKEKIKGRQDDDDDDDDDVAAYEEAAKDRADANLRRFVEAHLVPHCPWPERTKVSTLAGNEIWWESKQMTAGDDEAKKKPVVVVMPDKVEVDKVAMEVGNGQIWILKGALNTP